MVSIDGEPSDGQVVISVRDNGIGIAAKDVPKLFTPFERITAQRPGTGLGLSIVKKAIERMGGHVGVESQPGKGSRFWFSLPAASVNAH